MAELRAPLARYAGSRGLTGQAADADDPPMFVSKDAGQRSSVSTSCTAGSVCASDRHPA
ncbi:MAG TPA: hypothetical protein VIC05_01260 [Solirubrobacteraceae bacterium]